MKKETIFFQKSCTLSFSDLAGEVGGPENVDLPDLGVVHKFKQQDPHLVQVGHSDIHPRLLLHLPAPSNKPVGNRFSENQDFFHLTAASLMVSFGSTFPPNPFQRPCAKPLFLYPRRTCGVGWVLSTNRRVRSLLDGRPPDPTTAEDIASLFSLHVFARMRRLN